MNCTALHRLVDFVLAYEMKTEFEGPFVCAGYRLIINDDDGQKQNTKIQ